MKSDLDALMQAQSLDALVVVGPGAHNPPMVYLTGGAFLTSAILIKKRGETPILFYNAMERDEAARSGLPTRCLDEYRWDELLRQANGEVLQAQVLRFQRIFADLGLTSGRVAICGQRDAGEAYALFSDLQAALPDLTLIGEVKSPVLGEAMMTKDATEVERIRRMGQITTAVIGQVAEFLTSQQTQDGVLVQKDGQPVTIGLVKRKINLWLAEGGAANPEETIFAIGRDAGVPHSTGNPQDPLRLGQTIIFDIFPCEPGGGYFYDITRTWCLGYAPDEALALYEDVLAAYQQAMQDLQPNRPFRELQQRTCELFQARGHPTQMSDPLTQVGYVHSLGHGVGLHIHERPFSRLTATEGDRLQPGSVFTLEPGLYYPERGLGVRLEDTVWARPDGQFEILAPYPLDLVLPVR